MVQMLPRPLWTSKSFTTGPNSSSRISRMVRLVHWIFIQKLRCPKSVEKLTKKFIFNDPESLKYLLSKYHNKFACVILEPSGLIDADKSFLKSVRELCNKHKVILIFDEVISGFRIDLGGAQKKYDVIPDLSCFGKGMANGYPISAIVGKRKIMKIMKEIFFYNPEEKHYL